MHKIFCTHCGNELKKNVKFCTHCGARIDDNLSNNKTVETLNSDKKTDKKQIKESKPTSSKGGAFTNALGFLFLFCSLAISVIAIVLSFTDVSYLDWTFANSERNLYACASKVPIVFVLISAIYVALLSGIILIVLKIIKKEKETIVGLTFSLVGALSSAAYGLMLFFLSRFDCFHGLLLAVPILGFVNLLLFLVVSFLWYVLPFESRTGISKKMLIYLSSVVAASGLVFAYSAPILLSNEKTYEVGDYQFDGYSSITGYRGKDKIVIIPSKYSGHEITEITNFAFSGRDIEGVTIPQSIRIIGFGAFESCTNLKIVYIEGNVAMIGSVAFSNCTSLEWINLSSGLVWIDDYAFHNCGLTSVIIPETVAHIGNRAFDSDNLMKIFYLGSSDSWLNVSIGDQAFNSSASIWFYSAETPTEIGNYWHYDENNVPIIW